MGGMFGESKYEVLKKIPPDLVPRTILISKSSTPEHVLHQLQAANLSLPVIFKPDLGERGFMVEQIRDTSQIAPYLAKVRTDFLAQELVELPHEFGVFFVRHPRAKQGKVTSVVMKELLNVTGDGRSSLQELILKSDRAKLQWDRLQIKFARRLKDVLAAGEVLNLVPIGNHALGTKFLNGERLINERLHAKFDEIGRSIEGFYFGRFDLRCASIEDLYEGRIRVLELNGCGAEPAHIYDPDYSFFKAVIVLLRHWRTIFEISRENHRNGIPYISISEARTHYSAFKKATS